MGFIMRIPATDQSAKISVKTLQLATLILAGGTTLAMVMEWKALTADPGYFQGKSAPLFIVMLGVLGLPGLVSGLGTITKSVRDTNACAYVLVGTGTILALLATNLTAIHLFFHIPHALAIETGMRVVSILMLLTGSAIMKTQG